MTLNAQTEVSLKSRRSRFEAALSKLSEERQLFDEVLCETPEHIVVPTLGSIVPYWLLIIPRVRTLNFRTRSKDRVTYLSLINSVLEFHNVQSDRAIWFEHGSVRENSMIGCGVEHAHIHLLIDTPFSYAQFKDAAIASATLQWTECPAKYAYANLSVDSSYLVAGDMNRAFFATDVDFVGSQFFRRIVAGFVGRPDTWDYKTHPYIENVKKTLTRFGTGNPVKRVA